MLDWDWKHDYLAEDSDENEKVKDTKCAIKSELKVKNYENCLEVNRLENKIKYLQKTILK